jgi:hypothetical protein
MVALRRRTYARARQSRISSTADARRFNYLSACICVHLWSIFLAIRPSAQMWGSIFMVEQVNRLPPPVEGAHGGA